MSAANVTSFLSESGGSFETSTGFLAPFSALWREGDAAMNTAARQVVNTNTRFVIGIKLGWRKECHTKARCQRNDEKNRPAQPRPAPRAQRLRPRRGCPRNLRKGVRLVPRRRWQRQNEAGREVRRKGLHRSEGSAADERPR